MVQSSMLYHMPLSKALGNLRDWFGRLRAEHMAILITSHFVVGPLFTAPKICLPGPGHGRGLGSRETPDPISKIMDEDSKDCVQACLLLVDAGRLCCFLSSHTGPKSLDFWAL